MELEKASNRREAHLAGRNTCRSNLTKNGCEAARESLPGPSKASKTTKVQDEQLENLEGTVVSTSKDTWPISTCRHAGHLSWSDDIVKASQVLLIFRQRILCLIRLVFTKGVRDGLTSEQDLLIFSRARKSCAG